MVLVVISCLFGAVFLGICVVFTGITLGFSKKNVGKTRGFLESVKHERNVRIGRPATRYPHYVTAVYVYRVQGKQFHVTWRAPGTPQEVPNSVTVFYQRKYPQLAYMETGPFVAPFTAIVTGLLGAMFLLMALLRLYAMTH